MKKTLGILTLLFGMCLMAPVVAKAETIEINLEEEYGDSCTIDNVQDALDMSRDDEDNLYVVKVPAGVYKLKVYDRLKIYSNTTVDLTGVTLKRTASSTKGAMLQIADPRNETGKSTAAGGGYTKGKYSRAHDITIIGGVIDAGKRVKNVSTLCTFSHVQNITIDGTTFKYKPSGTNSAHMIEFGASKNVTIKNCKFIGNQKVGSAVQIESAVKNVASSDLMGKEDGTKTKNVKLIGNTFTNFQYAFGTNHGCKKDIYKGIVIQDNRFERITKYAICTYNYKAAKIKGNVITKSGKASFNRFILKLGQKDSYKMSGNKVK